MGWFKPFTYNQLISTLYSAFNLSELLQWQSQASQDRFFIIPLISFALFCFYTGYAEDPARTVEKGLLCFNNKLVSCGCDEEYRLNESGNIDVPPQMTDLFCNGPHLAETQLHQQHIFSFPIQKKASSHAISDTIRARCSFSRQRGNFNVAQYTSPAPRITISMSLYGWIVFGFCLLLI